MRKFCDIVFSNDCISFGKSMGFDEVYFEKFRIEKGSTYEKNQAAVRKKIHIFLDPVTESKRNFDTAIARIAKDNNVTIGISLKSILEKTGAARMIYLRALDSMFKICSKTGNNIIIISGAKSKYDMRNPEQLAAVGALFGMDKAKQLWSVSEAYGVIT